MKTSKLHFANVFFELDFTHKNDSIHSLLSLHENFYQLQFIPLLYKEHADQVLVSHLPEAPIQDLLLIQDVEEYRNRQVELWGHSNCIHLFQKENQITHFTSPQLVETLSSKLWSFPFSKQYLKHAKIISTTQELHEFFSSPIIPCVIKTIDGFSSRGNRLILDQKELTTALFSLFDKILEKSCLIVEPWLKRIRDFSTQWLLDDQGINCLGATILLNSTRGSYQGSLYDPKDPFLKKQYPAIEYHYSVVTPILKNIYDLGFRGNLGIDAFFYTLEEGYTLQPIVEINPRKTMGYVAIKVAENNRIESPILLRLQEAKYCHFPLLPTQLIVNNKLIKFKKNLEIQTDPGVIANASNENSRWETFKWIY
jgi:hypothetical protein